jgi:hypothetical protein
VKLTNKCNKSRIDDGKIEASTANKPRKDIDVGASTDAASQTCKKCLKVCRKIPLPESFMELHSTMHGGVCN